MQSSWQLSVSLFTEEPLCNANLLFLTGTWNFVFLLLPKEIPSSMHSDSIESSLSFVLDLCVEDVSKFFGEQKQTSFIAVLKCAQKASETWKEESLNFVKDLDSWLHLQQNEPTNFSTRNFVMQSLTRLFVIFRQNAVFLVRRGDRVCPLTSVISSEAGRLDHCLQVSVTLSLSNILNY